MADTPTRKTPLSRIAEFEEEPNRPPNINGLLQGLIASVPVGVLVVNEESRIVEINEEAETMFGYPADEIVGQNLGLLLPDRFKGAHSDLVRAYIAAPSRRTMGKGRDLLAMRKDGSEFPVEIGLAGVDLPSRRLFSAVVIDITHRRTIEQERERLIAQLQDAMAEIKTLSGLLPICAGCKKIRDDKGCWNQIEIYLRDRSEAEFTHGLCPGCAKALYSDIDVDS